MALAPRLPARHSDGAVRLPCQRATTAWAHVHNREDLCRLCGASLDPRLEHSDCCDPAGATRGHYAVVRALVRGLRLADPAVTGEPRGLTTSQSRPAYVGIGEKYPSLQLPNWMSTAGHPVGRSPWSGCPTADRAQRRPALSASLQSKLPARASSRLTQRLCCRGCAAAILRRRAAMMRAVLPRAGAAAEWLLTGYSGAPPTSDFRAKPLFEAKK